MKKAQGALEFLMTYGWAFLVILIMIGALAYFGVLDPSRFVPDKCVTASGIICNRYVANNVEGAAGAPTVAVEIKNNMGAPIFIYGAQVTAVDPSSLGRTSAAITDGAVVAASDMQVAFDNTPALEGQLTTADVAVGGLGLGAVSPDTTPGVNDNRMADGETRTILVKMGNGATSLVEKRKMTLKINFKYYPQDSSATYAKDIPLDLVLTVQ